MCVPAASGRPHSQVSPAFREKLLQDFEFRYYFPNEVRRRAGPSVPKMTEGSSSCVITEQRSLHRTIYDLLRP